MRTDLRLLIIAGAAACAAVAAPGALAEIYKWTNEDGTTTYSNAPPADNAAAQDVAVIVPEVPPVPVRAMPAQKVQEPQPKTAEAAARPEGEAPRAPNPRALLPQAVQDPCLRSSDRFCHQKHSAHYRPYVGYTPEPRIAEAPPAVAPARGATNGTAGGGTVGGVGR